MAQCLLASPSFPLPPPFLVRDRFGRTKFRTQDYAVQWMSPLPDEDNACLSNLCNLEEAGTRTNNLCTHSLMKIAQSWSLSDLQR